MNRFSPPPREINFAFLLVWPTFSFHFFFSFSLLQVLDCGENSTFPVSNEKKALHISKNHPSEIPPLSFWIAAKTIQRFQWYQFGNSETVQIKRNETKRKKSWRPQRRLQNYESALSLIEFGRLNILFCIAEATLFARAKFGIFLLPAKRTQVRYKSRRQFVCSGSFGLIYPEEQKKWAGEVKSFHSSALNYFHIILGKRTGTTL